MSFEKLLTELSTLSDSDLNEILDQRDQTEFDIAWTEANNQVDSKENFPYEKETFIALSNASKNHEIASYLIDDYRLVFFAEKRNIQTPFIKYLQETLKSGQIPKEWKG